MAELVHAPLDWKVFSLSGRDRKEFLHGLVTADIKGMGPDREVPCCLLTPKGKLQAHFWAYEEGEALLLACPPETSGTLKAGLEKVIPLSESKLEELPSRRAVWASGGGAGFPFSGLGKGGRLLLSGEPAPGRALSSAELEERRVASGLPRWGVDVDAETIPLEARLEPAISYTKGCYMGQETISRIHHMGHVNRLLVGLRFPGGAPSAPAPVVKGGAEIGRLTSAAGDLALATVRREDAAAGAAVEAGGRAGVVVDLWS